MEYLFPSIVFAIVHIPLDPLINNFLLCLPGLLATASIIVYTPSLIALALSVRSVYI